MVTKAQVAGGGLGTLLFLSTAQYSVAAGLFVGVMVGLIVWLAAREIGDWIQAEDAQPE